MTDRLILTLGILGGTGNEGQGLAYRWAKAGYHVIIGSRTPDKAERVAADVNQKLGQEAIQGKGNQEAAQLCDIAILTVPYSAHRATLEGLRSFLQGKVLVDVTVPISPPDILIPDFPPEGSACEQAQAILGERVRVVGAFHNISHIHLQQDTPINCDVLVCGDSESARKQVLQLVSAAGMAGWDAGGLKNASTIEGLTPILLGINKRHGIRSAGIRITGAQMDG